MSRNSGRSLAPHVQAAIAAGQGVGQAKITELGGRQELAAHVQAAIAAGQRVGRVQMKELGGGREVAAHVQAAIEAGLRLAGAGLLQAARKKGKISVATGDRALRRYKRARKGADKIELRRSPRKTTIAVTNRVETRAALRAYDFLADDGHSYVLKNHVYTYRANNGTLYSFKTDSQGCVEFTQPVNGHRALQIHNTVDLHRYYTTTDLTENYRGAHFQICNTHVYGPLNVHGSNSPNGFTWHHHKIKGLMQLVDREVHSHIPHRGGWSIWGKK